MGLCVAKPCVLCSQGQCELPLNARWGCYFLCLGIRLGQADV
jgi:hypothetical protein